MSNKLDLAKFVTLISILILIIVSLSPIIPGETITQFGKAGSEVSEPDITYSIKKESHADVAIDATGYFEIPSHRGEIKKASLKIKCEGEDDSYLTDPRLDIGLDGDYEWRFNGKGYGKAGQQTKFSSDSDKRTIITAKRGSQHYDDRSSILLPKTATVQSASMKIKGGPGQYTEDLVVSVYYYRGRLYYTKSNRDGTFTSIVSYINLYSGTSYGYYYGVGLGDFDGDNRDEIAFVYMT